jgi:hypothetical protein
MKNLFQKLELCLLYRLLYRHENRNIGHDHQVVDCCLYLRESLQEVKK